VEFPVNTTQKSHYSKDWARRSHPPGKGLAEMNTSAWSNYNRGHNIANLSFIAMICGLTD